MNHGTMYDLYKRDERGEPVAAKFRIAREANGWLRIEVATDEPDAREPIVVRCLLVSGRFVVDVIDADTLEPTEEICGAVATGTISIPLHTSRKEDGR